MLKRPKSSNVNPEKPLPFWLLVGASSVAMAGLLGTISTRTVQADARLPRPAALATPGVVNATTPTAVATSHPTSKSHGKLIRGVASWYGAIFNGRHTASGERFDMYALTACHPTLPFGSKVRVVNLRNKKSVVVRITDRGDLINDGRIIDLSYGAAERLDMAKAGLARVSVEVLSLGHSSYKDN
jgi:rare lipoprotein A